MLFAQRQEELADREPASGLAAPAAAPTVAPGAPAMGFGAAPAGPDVMALRAALFAPFADAAGAASGAAHARPHAKKSATKEEVKAIQALLDQARKAGAEAAALEREAAALRRAHDHGATAKANQAHARRRAAGGFKQEAMTRAVGAYGIDISHVTRLMYANDNTDGDSETDERAVTIGDDAFSQNPAWLASTIAHEAEIHVNMQTMRGRAYEGAQGRRLNEIQAYDWEIANAKRFGLDADQVASLRRNRAHYMEGLSTDNQRRRAAGDYSLPKGHEED